MFEAEIKNKFKSYGFELSDKQVEQFKTYYNLLVLWNKKFNLTAITSQSDVIIKHFVDSVLPINEIPQNAVIADIGTGAGFPGIPLKIMREDVTVYLIEPLKKRTMFLDEVITSLELEGVVILPNRAEVVAHDKEYRETFDIATSRAVARLNTILEISVPLLKVGGKVLAYKSAKAEEEIQEAEVALKTLNTKIQNVLNFNIEETSSERNIIVLEKEKATPKEFPRGQNKPKTNPLV